MQVMPPAGAIPPASQRVWLDNAQSISQDKELSLVKELSKNPTAMTSPQRTSATEVVSATATNALEGASPRTLQLTADRKDSSRGPTISPITAAEEEEDGGREEAAVPVSHQNATDGWAPAAEMAAAGGDSETQAAESMQDNQPDLPPVTAAQMAEAILNDPNNLDPPAGLNQMSDPFGNNAFGGDAQFPPQIADGMPFQDLPYLDPSPYIGPPIETRISAFAKLEFGDSEYYMNTHQLVLGRDLAAYRAITREASRRALEKEHIKEEEANPKTPVRTKGEQSRYTKSIVSESGGILREEEFFGDDKPRRRQKNSKKSKSSGELSQSNSRRNSLAPAKPPRTYEQQSLVGGYSVTVDAVPVDPASLRPSPYECPLLGIHPPSSAADDIGGYKSISREHVKIAYNSKKSLFEATIIGRNGAFIDDEFQPQDAVKELKSGSTVQIGTVNVRFVLPDVAIGQTGAEPRPTLDEEAATHWRSASGKEMSMEFEGTYRIGEDGVAHEFTPEPSDDYDDDQDDQREELGEDNEDDEEDDLEEEEGNEDEQLLHSVERDDESDEIQEPEVPKPLTIKLKIEKVKRGPGRPPKNGIRSKREEQLAKKEALARAKDANSQPKPQTQQPAAPPVPGKNKVGRPRKHPLPENPTEKKEKRKYTKRKPKEPKDPNAKQEGSGDEAKEKKEKKPAKPPRSPSPVFNEADLTPEQLQKPTVNYVTMIYDAIKQCEAGKMSLPQIYRAIARKYPYFVVRVSTMGWQSSVRHNLSQNNAFYKVERDGKGWMWGIVEGVSIEKEKKRRTPPPQHMHHPQQIYQAGQPHHPHIYPYGPPPPGMMYGPPVMHPGMHSGHPAQWQHMNGYPPPPPPGSQHPHQQPPPNMNGHHPPAYPPPNLPPQLAPPTTAYRSPYAPDPAAAPAAPPRAPQPIPQVKSSQSPPQNPSSFTQAPPRSAPPTENTNPRVLEFLSGFRAAMVAVLRTKGVSDPEAILASAESRALGRTTESAIPGGSSDEDGLVETLKNAISQISGPATTSINPAPAQQNGQPQSVSNQNGTQNAVIATVEAPEQAAPAIQRPSFRAPRPSMPPELNRISSGSPANVTRHDLPPSTGTPAPPLPVANSGSAIAEPPAPRLPVPNGPAANGASASSPQKNQSNPQVQPIQPIAVSAESAPSNATPSDGCDGRGSKRALEADEQEQPEPKRLNATTQALPQPTTTT